MAEPKASSSSSQPSDTGRPLPIRLPDQPQGRKVAIPRLRRPSADDDGSLKGSGDKSRVPHACEPCRQRKTKCSGERPSCTHCQDFKIACYYADGKRDRAKNEVLHLRSRVQLLEKLLDQLQSQADSGTQAAITKVLHAPPPEAIQPRREIVNCDGESLVTAEIGSTGSADHIKEDLNDNAPYSTGYLGKNSEVSWIQRVAQQLSREANHNALNYPQDIDDDEYQFKTPTYHLDDLNVPMSRGQIDPYSIPDKAVANTYINTFLDTVYPTYPLGIMKKTFVAQYEAFFVSFFPPGNSKRWLAQLNLMFAIGALYEKYTTPKWKGGDSEHLKYFTRARILGIDDGAMFEVPDLQQVQVVGLATIYLIASNQINRAWTIFGLAIRHAHTLGFHLRYDVPDIDETEKEVRRRLWYSLQSLETLLCLMTGRPSAIHKKHYRVPLPRPVDDDVGSEEDFKTALRKCATEARKTTQLSRYADSSSGSSTNSGRLSHSSVSSSTNAASSGPPPLPTPRLPPTPDPPAVEDDATSPAYFLELAKLNEITSEVLNVLYSPSIIDKSWSEVQGQMSNLEIAIISWRNALPQALDITKGQKDSSNRYRQQLHLAVQYNNTRILINRPCLCQLDYKIPNESNRSRTFNRSAAATCISAARETVKLLPDEPDPIGLMRIWPWWGLLHYLVSAGTILIVEISMRAEHNPQQAEGLLRDSKKVLCWLRALATDNIAAERSWAVLTKFLLVSAPKIGGDTTDVERDLGLLPTSMAHVSLPNMSLPLQSSMASSQGAREMQSSTADVLNTDMPNIYRGLVNDSYHFDNIPPIQTLFDDSLSNTTGMPQVSHSTSFHSPGASSNATPVDGVFPNISNQELRRRQKQELRDARRMLQGVFSISMPTTQPPMWSDAETYALDPRLHNYHGAGEMHSMPNNQTSSEEQPDIRMSGAQ